MKTALAFLALCFLVSCTTGTVYIATNENEGIRSGYDDSELSRLATSNQPLLKEMYGRLRAADVPPYPNGIGFTRLLDDKGGRHYYLLVDVRPPELLFDQRTTTPEKRFNYVLEKKFEQYVRILKKQDVQVGGIEGVAFGVYWPVRDFSQCQENGGFIEYIRVYFPKSDMLNLLAGTETFNEAVDNGEIMTSLGLQPPKSIRVRRTG